MKKIILYILLIGFLLPVYGQAISKEQLIGKVYKHINQLPGFKNYKEEEGIMILPLGTGNGFTKISDGKNTMILFTKYIAPTSYKILAVLDLGTADKNIKVIMARCRVNSKNDGEIVVLVKPGKGDYLKNVIKAWRADEKTNRFISIPTKGIDCINDEDDVD